MRLDKLDILVLFCVGVKLATILIMSYTITILTTITKTSIENVVATMEANPLASLVVQAQKMSFTLSTFLIPGLMFTLYFILKRYTKPDILQLYVGLLLFTTVADFLHDFGGLLGLFVKMGLV